MLISAEHLSINFGSRQLLDDVDFYLNEGDKTGVIGINGTGKSTFLKVLAGVAPAGQRDNRPQAEFTGERACTEPRYARRSDRAGADLCQYAAGIPAAERI